MPVPGSSLAATSQGAKVPMRVAVPDIVAEESYLVRNNHRGSSTFTYGSAVNGELFRWEPKGDVSGGDVQALPGYVVKSPQFQRALKKGLFSLIMEGEEDPLTYAGEVWQDQAAAQEEGVMANLEREADLELHDLKCMGPGAKGTGAPCGEQLWMRGMDLETKPPLCPRHERFAHYFERENGEWKRLAQPKAQTDA